MAVLASWSKLLAPPRAVTVMGTVTGRIGLALSVSVTLAVSPSATS